VKRKGAKKLNVNLSRLLAQKINLSLLARLYKKNLVKLFSRVPGKVFHFCKPKIKNKMEFEILIETEHENLLPPFPSVCLGHVKSLEAAKLLGYLLQAVLLRQERLNEFVIIKTLTQCNNNNNGEK
jgi:hypothetical protein